MPDLVVDLDGLEDFGDRLTRITQALGDTKTVLRGQDDVLGDGTVVSALERFEDRWRDGREKITGNAKTLSSMVTSSVQTYRQADADLAASLTTSSR